MNILLISPSVSPDKKTNRQLMMPQLALYILEGLTPPGHSVQIVEEEAEALDLNLSPDLVGISCMTANAPRAYVIAEHFRNRGIPVILGGVHPTILPEEAALHADCVVTGEAEKVWPLLLKDQENKCLKPRYNGGEPDLSQYVPKDFSKIISRRLFSLVPIMTSRGCPYNCDFCSVTDLFGKKIRHVPIENVIQDIQAAGSKNFMFLDDNIIGHPKYAKELFRAIAPLKINWVGQASVSLLVKEPELLDLAAESGCRGLFIGLESIVESKLKEMRKAFNTIPDLEAALRKVRKKGILIHASMIFGFDEDTPDVFRDTVRFLIRNKVSTVSFNVLTPYPGTKTFSDMDTQHRLLTHDWRYFDHNTVVYQPRSMSPVELQTGKTSARESFYSLLSVFRRFWGNLRNPLIYLATNIGHMRQVKIEKERLVRLKRELFN